MQLCIYPAKLSEEYILAMRHLTVTQSQALKSPRIKCCERMDCSEKTESTIQQPSFSDDFKKVFYYIAHVQICVIGRRAGGAAPVKTSTGNNFPREYQRIPRNYYQYWC